ncbi:anthranilate phosphoribosyltransferase [Kineosporia sp. NBRC 101731]|uniref:anthranilate phosphoribosyltransferase n=1 Tax=Kineosporia sp. NBRC 101731 TaxID=3032199 RepID=UPI0024A29120|nr:anthranilate phosphoribosyltransferase [Kineosporia sp. NBRC 101731]GLY32831.1 anthranilate phosphoribosyltransferase 1 [Kineosporia sp. NBRC 101731]
MSSPAIATPSWPLLITTLISGQDLSRPDTEWAMEQVMTDRSNPVQLAAFLVALRAKGETVQELGGLVDVMLRHAVRIEIPGPAVDIVGTGGDMHKTVNISTMSAIVAAGTGIQVIKHGNRAASSSSGAADVLESLGLRLDLPNDRIVQVAQEVGITFLFAMKFHPALRFAGPTRAELKVPTAFNFLGPLTNPAQPGVSAIGCANLRMAPIMAGVLAERGDRALVFRGEDGLDELSTTGPSRVWQVSQGSVTESLFDPADLGLARATLDDLRGGDPQHNAQVVRDLLAGKTGPVRDAVLLNAGAALAASGPADSDLTKQISEGVQKAAESIDSGAAAAVLERWVAATNA